MDLDSYLFASDFFEWNINQFQRVIIKMQNFLFQNIMIKIFIENLKMLLLVEKMKDLEHRTKKHILKENKAYSNIFISTALSNLRQSKNVQVSGVF